MTKTNAPLCELVEMLARMRPAGSKSERRFIAHYIRPLGVQTDKAGNLIKRIGTTPVLWSCHTDTVHREGGYQLVTVENGVAKLASSERSNCLGADCTVGVWLMLEMIRANRPGLYVFHRGEECGGVGSTHIAKNTPELLDGIKYAIALDRYGYRSVITHQFTRCCSDTFAHSLVDALDTYGLEYELDDGGVFTDTANYTDIIGECTNLSVGYFCQHTSREHLDLNYAEQLRNALLRLDVSTLKAKRQPGEVEPDYYSLPGKYGAYDQKWDYVDDRRQARLIDLVSEHTDIVADLLEDFGYDAEGLLQEIYERSGQLASIS